MQAPNILYFITAIPQLGCEPSSLIDAGSSSVMVATEGKVVVVMLPVVGSSGNIGTGLCCVISSRHSKQVHMHTCTENNFVCRPVKFPLKITI